MEPMGQRLLDLVALAKSEVVLVAPFQKEAALRKVLDAIPHNVKVTCITRWRPEEIAKGVSDLGCWPALRERNATMRLRIDLHAKVYRADKYCLVGSANLTRTGLGWVVAPNLEVLIAASADDPDIDSFFKELYLGTTLVSEAVYQQMSAAVAGLDVSKLNFHSEDEDTCCRTDFTRWLPCCMHPGPHNLYYSYKGKQDLVISSTYDDAQRDLQAMSVPPGIINETAFNHYIAGVLRQSPVVAAIDALAQNGLGNSVGQSFLVNDLQLDNGLDRVVTDHEWETLKGWLLCFLPNRYRERNTGTGPEFLIGNIIA